MVIVGLTGGIGHGKTTFAASLAAQASSFESYESSAIITEIANALRASKSAHPKPTDIEAVNTWLTSLPGILQRHTRVTVPFEQITITPQRLKAHPEYYQRLFDYLQLMHDDVQLASQTITVQNKGQFRSLLQWLGGYLVKAVDEGIWYDEIVRRIQEGPQVDLVVVGGIRFPADARRIHTAGGTIIEITRPSGQQLDTTDLTERERASIVPDSTVYNDGTLAKLQSVAAKVYKDLQSGRHAAEYSATKH